MIEEADKRGYIVHKEGSEAEWQKIRRIEKSIGKSKMLVEVSTKDDDEKMIKFNNSEFNRINLGLTRTFDN